MNRDPVEELIDLLQLDRLEDNIFRGESRDIGTRCVFGGQVLGQALAAAQNTVAADRAAHSLHAYFLRAGDVEQPIVYLVERTRDGGSFSMRQVTAIQHGQPIFELTASFHVHESGVEHQMTLPDVPRADDLEPAEAPPQDVMERLPAKLKRWFSPGPFEFRPVYPQDELRPPKRPPSRQIWFRLRERIGDDPVLHRSLLAYASDFQLIGTAMLPHGISFLQNDVQVASLDHAMWFHRPFRVDDWLLYACDSPTAFGARGLARGTIFDATGRLVASTAQEGLIRLPGAG